MQRRGRGVADVSVPGSAHFCSGIYRNHVYRVTLVQPRSRSYSVTSDKERNVRITPIYTTNFVAADLRATKRLELLYRGARLCFHKGNNFAVMLFDTEVAITELKPNIKIYTKDHCSTHYIHVHTIDNKRKSNIIHAFLFEIKPRYVSN